MVGTWHLLFRGIFVEVDIGVRWRPVLIGEVAEFSGIPLNSYFLH
jgi:hypothetical protein